jgi:hypothetical protein
MALYKYPEYVRKTNDTDFDIEYRPGEPTPHSGIYRCICGREDVSERGNPLPSQNHEQHPQGQPIRWKLNVRSQG